MFGINEFNGFKATTKVAALGPQLAAIGLGSRQIVADSNREKA